MGLATNRDACSSSPCDVEEDYAEIGSVEDTEELEDFDEESVPDNCALKTSPILDEEAQRTRNTRDGHVLVVKNLSHKQVTVHFDSLSWFQWRGASFKSHTKVLESGETYGENTSMKYRIVKETEELMPSGKLYENTLIKITDDSMSLEGMTGTNLSEFELANPNQQSYTLLVKNLTEERVTVYFYSTWFPWHTISFRSRNIEPADKYRVETSMKYQIYQGEAELQPVTIPTRNTLIQITSDGVYSEEMTCNNRLEFQLAEQYDHFLDEHSSMNQEDYYAMLGLDMEEIRALSYPVQTRRIKVQFNKLSLKYHPDKHRDNPHYNGDIWKKYQESYEKLKDPKRRVEYHNEYDFNQSYGTKKFWNSLFYPEVYDEDEEKSKKLRKYAMYERIACFATSVGMAGVGAWLSGGTVPLAILGWSLLMGGTTSLRATLQLKLTLKKWAKSAGLGVVGGAAVGGLAVPIAVVAGTSIGGLALSGSVFGGAMGATDSIIRDTENWSEGGHGTFKGAARRAFWNFIISAPFSAAGGAIAAALGGTQLAQILKSTNTDEGLLGLIAKRVALKGAGWAVEGGAVKLGRLIGYGPVALIEERIEGAKNKKGNRSLVEHYKERDLL